MAKELNLSGHITCKGCKKKLLIKKFKLMKTDIRFFMRKCPRCKKRYLLPKRELIK
jgi:hypothetical protein